MATDHSTETSANLFKAIHPETHPPWVLCVDPIMCVDGASSGVNEPNSYTSELVLSGFELAPNA